MFPAFGVLFLGLLFKASYRGDGPWLLADNPISFTFLMLTVVMIWSLWTILTAQQRINKLMEKQAANGEGATTAPTPTVTIPDIPMLVKVIQEPEKGGDEIPIKPKKYLGPVPNPRRLLVKLHRNYNEVEMKTLLIHRAKIIRLYRESNFNGEYLEALKDFDSVYNPILYEFKHCRFAGDYEALKGGDVG